MPKQLNVNLAFTADTGKAAAGIKSLQQQLTQLMNTAASNSASLGLTKDIKEATNAAAQLKVTLNNAMTSSGTLDLTKFNDSLKASGMTLEEYRIKLQALGPEGTQAFSALASQISSAEIPLKRANTLLTGLGTTLMNTARWQLSSSLLHGFIGGLQSAYGYAQDLNESLNNIRIVTGQSTEQMAQLAQKANQAAQQLSTRTTDYTNASLIYYQQGLDDKAVEERTRTTLKLSNVTRQSAEEVANQMTAIWNNFDDGTKSLEYYADAITALGAKTASSSSEIADGLSKFASIADTVGLSYEYATAALATVVAETRQSADTVGNAFKSLFARIQSVKLGETLEDGVGLTKYTQALETVGVQVLDINGELREADDILDDLGERWSEISDGQKAALAQTVAGQRQYAQMIALMDNWDKVKENVGIASESEGTLQEQQEIYAESWEASAKRVRASAEAIYDALLNDDFFIGFNDLLSGILNRINDLIKGLGGLPGVLTTVGALLTRVFSAQLSSQIERIGHNITMMTQAGRQQVQAQREQANQQLIQMAQQSAQKGTQIGIAQGQAYSSQASLQQTLIDNAEKLNEAEKQHAQLLLDTNRILGEEAVKQAEIADQAQKQKNASIRQTINNANQYNNANIGRSVIPQDLTDAITDMDRVSQGIASLSNEFISFEQIIDDKSLSVSGKITNIKEIFTKNIDSIHEALQKTGQDPAIIDDLINKLESGQISIQGFSQELAQLSNTADNNGQAFRNILIKSLEEYYDDVDLATQAADKLIEKLREAASANADLSDKTKVLDNTTKASTDTIKQMGTQTYSTAQAISGIASIAMSLASVINSVRSAIDIWNNEDLTWGEKLLQIIPSLLMSVSMLTSALTGQAAAAVVSKLATLPLISGFFEMTGAATAASGATLTLGVALKTAFPILLAITGAVFAVKKAFDAWDASHYTYDEKIEDAKAAAEGAAEAAESAKQKFEGITEAIDKYESVKSTLDECTTGTNEWRDALKEVQDVATDLIKQYPELAQFYDNKTGTLDTEGVKNYQKKLDDQANIANFQSLYTPMIEQRLAKEQARDTADVNKSILKEDTSNYQISNGALQGIFQKQLDDEAVEFADQWRNNMPAIEFNKAEFTGYLEDAMTQMENDGLELSLENYKSYFKDYLSQNTDLLDQLRTVVTERSADLQKNGESYFAAPEKISSILETFIDYLVDDTSETLKIFADAEEKERNYVADLQRVGSQVINTQLLNSQYQQELSDLEYNLLIQSLNKNIEENSVYEKAKDKTGDLTGEYDFSGKTNIRAQDIKYGADEDWQREFSSRYLENTGEALKFLRAEGNEEDRKYIFEDANGDEVSKTAEEMSAALATATYAVYNFEDSIQSAKEQAKTLFPSASSAVQDAFANSIGKTGDKAIDLRQVSGVDFNNIETKGARSYLEDLATEAGMSINDFADAFGKTAEQLVIELESGIKYYNDGLTQLGNTFTYDTQAQNALDKILKEVETASLDTRDKIKDQYIKAYMTEETEDDKILSDFYTANAKHADDINNLDWSNIDTVRDLNKAAKDLGFTIEGVTAPDFEILKGLFQETGQEVEDFGQTFSSRLAEVTKITSNLEKGSTISAEDYETLGTEITDGFFAPMADGTYILTAKADEFQTHINQITFDRLKDRTLELQNSTSSDLTSRYKNFDELQSNSIETPIIKNPLSPGEQFKNAAEEFGSEQNLKDKISYLEEIGVLTAFEAEQQRNSLSDESKRAEITEKINNLIKDNADGWDEIVAKSKEEQEELEKNRQMVMSIATSGKELKSFFDSGVFGDAKWSDVLKDWFNNYFNPSNINTLEQYKEALEGINGEAKMTSDQAKEAWKNIDPSTLKMSDLSFIKEEFKAGRMEIEKYKTIISSLTGQASSLSELHKLLDDATPEDYSAALQRILNSSGSSTKEALEEIDKAILNGKADAELLGTVLDRIMGASDLNTAEKAQELENRSQDKVIENPDRPGHSKTIKAEISDKDAGLGMIELAQNADDLFDNQKLDLFNQGLEKIGDTSELTAVEVGKIGAAATSIYKDSDFFTLDEQIKGITDAFKIGGEENFQANLKGYADAIKDLIINSSDFSLDQKIATLAEKLEEAGVPAEYLDREIADLILAQDDLSLEETIDKLRENLTGTLTPAMYVRDHLDELLNLNGGSTEDQIESLNTLLEEGLIKASQYSDKMYGVLEKSDYDAETQQYLANSAYQTEVAAAEEKIPEKQNPGDYSFDMQAYQAAYQQYKEDIDSAQQSYADWVKTIDATEFKSFDKLLDFFSAIPEGIDVSKQLAEVYRDYGDQFENAATEVEALDKALRSGNEAQIQQAQVAYESAVRAGEAAAQYGLNAEYLEVLSDHIRELNPDLADSLEVVNQLAVEQARLNVAMEDINDNGDQYIKTFEELSKYGKESVLANSDLSKSYESMRKTVANMLNVSEDFADELLNNKENAEDFEDALKGDEKAIQRLNKTAAKETIHKLGLDDDDFLNGVDSALAHLDELPEGKDIVLNVDTEGYDEQVANLITKMAEAENAIGGTITDLQEDLQGVDLGVEFELVSGEAFEKAKKDGDLLVTMAGDIADRAYSAMEGGTEAEVNTETTETKDEVEPPPDQEATVTQVDGWISSMTGGGGTAGEGGTGMNPVEVMNKPVTFPSVKYNATPETPETVEKADTVNTYRVKKAAPTNAGNVSHSNKTNRGGGGCFAAGTLISTNQGYKKIEDIQVGDIVLSYSLKNNQNEYSKVLQTMIHKITGNMYFIYVDGDVIESTEIHKFLIIRGNKAEWIAASDLKVSDLVYFADGTLHKIEMIKVKEKTLIVYNFEVDGNHNYYVGNNQILVHNKGGGCFIAGTLVMAKEGYKNIEDIQKGDIVLSFNEKKNQNEYSEVLNTMTHIVNENIYTLYIEDEKLIVTGIHRFLIIRKRAKGWVHASDLLIGDLVLFADGTWHEIHKIDVNVELKIVYNFEVSKNHNYYVGKNQILAHNKGRRGGGGSRPTGSAKVRAAAAHKEHEERYHVLDKKLGTLADSYKDVTSAKDRAFGSKHLKNIESEISLLEKEIAVQKDYRKEVEKFLKIDKASISKADQKGLTATELKDYEDRKASYQAIDVEKIKFKTKGKGNKWTAKESEINTKVDVSGYGGPVNFDANGNITNIEELKEAATAKYNQAAQDYASQHVDIGDISTKSKKEWKAEVKRQATITNEWNKAQAMYEQYMANLDKYEETLALKRQKITEAIEKEVNLIQAKLEKTSYQVEVKANIDDMSLKIINHALDMMGDKARNATARLGQLAEQLKTLNSTSSKMNRNGKKSNTGPGALSDNVWAISDILSNVTSSYKTITDNNGDIQYFNKENAKDSDYLNGNDLVKKMMAGGDSAKEVVNIIGKQQNITKDQFEKMMEYATSELERIQQMKEIRLQMFDIMSQTYDEETEKMDRLLDKQSFYMERANGYKNVLDIIGRANFAYNETKYNNGREAGRDLEEQIDNALLTQSQERIKTIDREKQNQENLRDLTAKSRTNAQNFIKALEATPETLKDLNKEQKEIYDANLTEWSGYSDQQKKDAIEQWKQDVDAFDEQIQKADDKIDELTLEKQTAFENALTLTEENWERAMERAKEAFEQAMAGTASSLELLLDGLDRYDKTHSTMVADYEKVYQLRNLELQAQESIDKANDPRIKRELLSIQEEITAASTQDKKMSQYELDYLRQKLELKEAEAALEDAQKAKTQVSLTRDNEGNFGYVYTADDAAVDDAEKNYADKIYEMRRTNQEYIQSLQAELAQAQQDAINAIMEINGRKDLTPEERDAEIAKISEDYHALHTNLIDQLNLALTNSNDVFGQYSELYSQITGDTMALNVDYVKDFTETQYSIQTGWKNTQQVADAFGDQMNTLLGEGGTLSKINAAYEANNKTTFENAGQDISTFAADSIKALTGEDGLNKAVQSLTGDMVDLGTSATENFGKVLAEVQKIEEDFTTYIGAMETSVTNLASALRDAALAMVELEDTADTAAATTTIDDTTIIDDTADVPSGSGNKEKGYKYYGSRKKRVRKTIRTARQANRINYKAAKAVLSRKQEDKIKRKYSSRSAQKRAMIKKAKTIVKKQLKTNKFAGVKIRFDTGGYTGDWGGNDGRVAMLHKKEMVLNQQDTSNILSAVGMIRDIAQKIDLNALSQSGALSSGISGINGVSNGTLEQEVHITAEFPNATDRNEISEAFNNIIGLAAQYANR